MSEWQGRYNDDLGCFQAYKGETVISLVDEESVDSLLALLNITAARLMRAEAHNESGERWGYLMSLKQDDEIGRAFALLEESILHHTNERDGWTPDDTCYMETTQQARELIEHKLKVAEAKTALAEEMASALRNLGVVQDGGWPLINDWLARYDALKEQGEIIDG